MAMNKVVHAAQRAAFSVAIDATINAVRGKGPENMAEQAVKLVNLAQPFAGKTLSRRQLGRRPCFRIRPQQQVDAVCLPRHQ